MRHHGGNMEGACRHGRCDVTAATWSQRAGMAGPPRCSRSWMTHLVTSAHRTVHAWATTIEDRRGRNERMHTNNTSAMRGERTWRGGFLQQLGQLLLELHAALQRRLQEVAIHCDRTQHT